MSTDSTKARQDAPGPVQASDLGKEYRAALRAAARGWHVFPTLPGRKEPATRNGLKDATTDPHVIRNFWNAHPGANVAVHTGRSGLLILDLDAPKGDRTVHGATTISEHPACADGQFGEAEAVTFVVLTPSGGLHLYFSDPGSPDRAPTAGRIGPGVDTRSGESYVVLHGTVGGKPYEYQSTADRIVDAPGWLLKVLQPPPPTVGNADVGYWTGMQAFVPSTRAGFNWEALGRFVREAPEGERNKRLHWAACRVAEAGVPVDEAEDVFTGWGVAAGLAESASRATARSAFRHGTR